MILRHIHFSGESQIMKNETLLSNIKDLCKKQSITIVALEKHLGIGAGTISRWNRATPSFDKIEAIADYFQISIDELSGRTINFNNTKIDKTTQMIIDFLLIESNAETSQEFWHDYKECPGAVNLLVDDMKSMNSDMNRLFYAYNEDGYYLFEVIYDMNNNFDYITNLRLYLTPDEKTKPVLECDCNSALKNLYINIMNTEQELGDKKRSETKVQWQREQILKKYMDLNQTDS